jgi:hypothetical protein
MKSNKATLTGSERQPLITRLSDQPGDEMIQVSVIVKPGTRAASGSGLLNSLPQGTPSGTNIPLVVCAVVVKVASSLDFCKS